MDSGKQKPETKLPVQKWQLRLQWSCAVIWAAVAVLNLAFGKTPLATVFLTLAAVYFVFTALTMTRHYRESRSIEAIVAVYGDWGIGADGTQPVVVAADRKHFRAVTDGCAIIVGRKTLADFPDGKPLRNRVNIVLTRQELELDGAETVHSAEEALAAAEPHGRVFVVGGESTYLLMFPHIQRIFVTKIDCIPHSDAFFPNLDEDPDWEVEAEEPEQTDENGIRFRFVTYIRRRKRGRMSKNRTEI